MRVDRDRESVLFVDALLLLAQELLSDGLEGILADSVDKLCESQLQRLECAKTAAEVAVDTWPSGQFFDEIDATLHLIVASISSQRHDIVQRLYNITSEKIDDLRKADGDSALDSLSKQLFVQELWQSASQHRTTFVAIDHSSAILAQQSSVRLSHCAVDDASTTLSVDRDCSVPGDQSSNQRSDLESCSRRRRFRRLRTIQAVSPAMILLRESPYVVCVPVSQVFSPCHAAALSRADLRTWQPLRVEHVHMSLALFLDRFRNTHKMKQLLASLCSAGPSMIGAAPPTPATARELTFALAPSALRAQSMFCVLFTWFHLLYQQSSAPSASIFCASFNDEIDAFMERQVEWHALARFLLESLLRLPINAIAISAEVDCQESRNLSVEPVRSAQTTRPQGSLREHLREQLCFADNDEREQSDEEGVHIAQFENYAESSVHQSQSVSVKPSPALSKRAIVAVALFAQASAINHSCAPNAFLQFDVQPRAHVFDALGKQDRLRDARNLLNSVQLSVQTNRLLRRDEEICISYGPLSATHSLSEREQELVQHYLFRCTCSACDDERHLVTKLMPVVTTHPSCSSSDDSTKVVAFCQELHQLHERLQSIDLEFGHTLTCARRSESRDQIVSMLQRFLDDIWKPFDFDLTALGFKLPAFATAWKEIRLSVAEIERREDFTSWIVPVVEVSHPRVQFMSEMDADVFNDYVQTHSAAAELCSAAFDAQNEVRLAAHALTRALRLQRICGPQRLPQSVNPVSTARKLSRLAQWLLSLSLYTQCAELAQSAVTTFQAHVSLDDNDYQQAAFALEFARRMQLYQSR